MAVVNGSNITVWNHTAPYGIRLDSSNNPVFSCYVSCQLSGTYAQADNAQMQNVHTAISGSRRDGKTVSLKTAECVGVGQNAGSPVAAKTVAVSTNDVTFEVTTGDFSTEFSNGAIATTEPIPFFVTYTLS